MRLPRQTLPDSAVLAVDGENPGAAFVNLVNQDFTGGYQRFLVGQSDGFASFSRRQRGLQTTCTRGSYNDDIYIPVAGDIFQRQEFAGWDITRFFSVGDVVYETRLELIYLFCQRFNITACRQPYHLKSARESPHDIQSLPSDGARRAQNCQPFYSISHYRYILLQIRG
ncbi:hypothetical protein ES703_102774 [subsurface metagenome]